MSRVIRTNVALNKLKKKKKFLLEFLKKKKNKGRTVVYLRRDVLSRRHKVSSQINESQRRPGILYLESRCEGGGGRPPNMPKMVLGWSFTHQKPTFYDSLGITPGGILIGTFPKSV